MIQTGRSTIARLIKAITSRVIQATLRVKNVELMFVIMEISIGKQKINFYFEPYLTCES